MICLRCKKELKQKFFTNKNFICKKCKQKEIDEKIFRNTFRYCKQCKTFKKRDLEIGRTVHICKQCRKENIEKIRLSQRKINVVRKCINQFCNNTFIVKKARATVVYCENCRKEKELIKRNLIENKKYFRTCYVCNNKEEVKNVHTPATYRCNKCKENNLTQPILKKYIRKCVYCKNIVEVNNKFMTFVKCEKCKKENIKMKQTIIGDKIYKECIKCNKLYQSNKNKLICNECSKIKSDRPNFGKKKHFGYYGIASDGHRWDSLHERDVDEWLIENKIKHIPHPRIGKTLYHADFLVNDLYLEVDGLERTEEYQWGNKLETYKKLGLKYQIVKPVVHLHENRQECFNQLDDQLNFLK